MTGKISLEFKQVGDKWVIAMASPEAVETVSFDTEEEARDGLMRSLLYGEDLQKRGVVARIELHEEGVFHPLSDDDFDLFCRCGHSYDDHTWSETPEGSTCEFVTCRCQQFNYRAI